jgi:hypothetical protein
MRRLLTLLSAWIFGAQVFGAQVFGMLVFVTAAPGYAQLLPDNQNLNLQAVNRWMQSNRDMAPLVQAIDARHLTPESFKIFEALTPVEQDSYIENILAEEQLQAQANAVVRLHGWKSLGEYMRFSSRLGNAIAAYFLLGDLGAVTPEQAQQLKEAADPAVLNVPPQEIEFIRRNEKALQQYIQAYSAGR